jgi:class 3 adenylate cyclase
MAVATVTVLFTDLVSSTEMLSRLGEEAAEVLRREHFRLLREAIAATGGHEVKNLGDGLMVAFDAVTSALSCSVSMQQVLEGRNRNSEEPLLVRIGISSGEAEVEEGDYFGGPVVEAARLCAKAGGGEILTTELVRLLAGSRGGFAFETVGLLELKGLDEPVSGFRVAWEPLAPENPTMILLPSRMEGGTTVFVGRSTERERLQGALDEAVLGQFRVVLVAGEAGIGKTSLASALARQAFDSGALVLYGRCEEQLGVPYQPWVEALGHLVRYAPIDMLTAHVAVHGGELAAFIPELAVRTGVASPTPARDGAKMPVAAVADLLSRAADFAPVVLVMDDLHWADDASAQLLRHVGTSDRQLRALIVGTFRDSKVDAGHPLASTLAAFRRVEGIERLVLRGLGTEEVDALIEEAVGRSVDEAAVELRDAILNETDGHPFFVREMLRHLVDEGLLYDEASGMWMDARTLPAAGLPLSIQEVIHGRVARLGEKALPILSMAAVIGRDFDLELLARVASADENTLIDVLDNAVADVVLVERDYPGQFRFAHALFQHALYRELSSMRRATAHRDVASALEEMCGDDPGDKVRDLTYHWALAAPRLTIPKRAESELDLMTLGSGEDIPSRQPEPSLLETI